MNLKTLFTTAAVASLVAFSANAQLLGGSGGLGGNLGGGLTGFEAVDFSF